MLLTGRYSLMSGEMKYQIPIIPLEDFNIQNGSYVSGRKYHESATEHYRDRKGPCFGGRGWKDSRIVGFDVGSL